MAKAHRARGPPAAKKKPQRDNKDTNREEEDLEEGWFREQKYFIKGLRLPNGEVREVYEPTKEQLLEQYANMPVRGVLQVDALALCAKGVIIASTPEYEPSFENPPIRLRLAEGTDRGVAQFYIAEIAKMLDEDWHRLDESSAGQRPRRTPPDYRSTPKS